MTRNSEFCWTSRRYRSARDRENWGTPEDGASRRLWTSPANGEGSYGDSHNCWRGRRQSRTYHCRYFLTETIKTIGSERQSLKSVWFQIYLPYRNQTGIFCSSWLSRYSRSGSSIPDEIWFSFGLVYCPFAFLIVLVSSAGVNQW